MGILDEIKSRVAMRDVLDYYGVHPVRGTNIYCCPFHQDKKPSANIIKNCEKFHCFSCQWTGDIFDVVQYFEKCDQKQAMRILDDRYNLGLYKQLTHKEKLEIARKQRERERAKAEKLAWEKFEKDTRHEILRQIEYWEAVQKQNHLTRGEYKHGTWSQERSSLFFTALKKQHWLNWLYDTICELQHPEYEFDYIYENNKKQLLEKIKKGEIKLCQNN